MTAKSLAPLETLDRVHLKRVTEEMVALPTLPLVASRLLEAVADPETSSVEVARILSLDPALTARTLKLANSDFYGFPRKVGSVDLAVVVLGADTIRDLVLSAAVFQSLDPTGCELTGLWNHSMACGVAARALAERLRYRLAGEAYAVGVLHDIGKVALRQSFPGRFDAVLALVRAQGVPMEEAERNILGADHAEIGGWLAERWGLPADMVEAIACHHSPERAGLNPDLAAIVHIANSLAERTGHAWPQGTDQHVISDFAWERVEPDKKLRQMLLDDLVRDVGHAVEKELMLFLHFRGSQEGGS